MAPVPGLPLQRQGAHPVSCSAWLWLLLTAQGIRVGWGGVGPLRRGRETTVSLRPAAHASTRLLAGPQCTRVQMVLVRASATCHTGEGWWWRPCPEGGCSWGEQAEEWQWRQESAAGAGHLRPRVHADHHWCRGRGPFIRGACWLRPCSVVAHCPAREGGSPHVLGEATPPTACWGSSSSPGEPCSRAGRGSLAEQHGGL